MADVESLDPVVVEGWYHVKTFQINAEVKLDKEH